MIKVYHTDNVIFNTSKYMENLLKNHQKIRFSGDVSSHKNGAAERIINMVVTMASAILMQAEIIYHKTYYPLILANVNGLCCMYLKFNP